MRRNYVYYYLFSNVSVAVLLIAQSVFDWYLFCARIVGKLYCFMYLLICITAFLRVAAFFSSTSLVFPLIYCTWNYVLRGMF
jgi:hypothetical protein